MRLLTGFLFALTLMSAPVAHAEVASSSPTSFVLRGEATVTTTPDRAWRALTQPGRWWSSAHTYSGDARRLTLDPRAGGCWCERWGDGQSVEHLRVVAVMENEGVRTLRTVGGLGPLQAMGVSGVLTFTVAPDASGAKVAIEYRVSGEPGLGLDQIAAPVDSVLMEQFGRLSRFIATGTPD